MDASAHAEPAAPPKPTYRFPGDAPPIALAHLRGEKVWLTWRFVWRAEKRKYDKPPHSATTGQMQKDWANAPGFLGTFDQAFATMRKRGLAGIGISLEHAGLTGIDLDRCITDSGSFSPVAAEAIACGETYGELSPSGEGVHFLARTSDVKTIKRDDLGIEVYSRGRYFTVTNDKIEGAPDVIAEAPRLIGRLVQLDAETSKPARDGSAAPLNGSNSLNGRARPTGHDFFSNVSDMAMQRLDAWAPVLHPTAKKQAKTGAWRITSRALGRDLEEDLSYHPDGIRDHGEEHGLTPIDAVIRYGKCADAKSAAMWLCEMMRVDPTNLGWKDADSHSRSNGHAHVKEAGTIEWPDPAPLPHSLLPVEPFDCAVLPEKVRPWVEDVSERMQCPPDYAGVTVTVALGSVIGRKVGVCPKREDNWTVIPNLWGMIIGRPGAQKSPMQNECLRPLKNLGIAAREDFNLAMAKHDLEVASAKARSRHAEKEAGKRLAKGGNPDLSDLLKPEKIEEPTLKRYITSSTTFASLAELTRQNPNGLLVERDEVLSLLDHLDEEGNADERGYFLTSWNGDSSYTVDRIGRGLDLHIDAVCISMIGGTQPARISQYLTQVRRGGRGNDGLIQRFGLMVWPDLSPTWTNIDRKPLREARDAAFRAFQMLDTLDWRVIGGKRDFGRTGDEEGLPYLRFCDDGQERFLSWRTELERRLRVESMDPMLEGHLAKYRKLVPALALITHLTDGGSGDVSDSAVEKAVRWAKYLETHAARTYGSTTIAAADAARAIIAKIKSGHLKKDGFSSREIVRAQWSLLRDAETIHAGLRLLVDHDWLDTRKLETRGRTATVYIVNPKALNFERGDGA